MDIEMLKLFNQPTSRIIMFIQVYLAILCHKSILFYDIFFHIDTKGCITYIVNPIFCLEYLIGSVLIARSSNLMNIKKLEVFVKLSTKFGLSYLYEIISSHCKSFSILFRFKNKF